MPALRQIHDAGRAVAAALLALLLPGCSLLFAPEEPEPPPAPPPLLAPLETTRFVLPDATSNVVGALQVVRLREQDTFIDVAQAYHLGFDELVEANPGIDPWLPGEGREIVLPSRFVLPDAPRQGIVLNVPMKRLFYFPKAQKDAPAVVHTFPISIGREGWATPLGLTRIVSKKKDPVWRVPASIRKEHAENGDPLPAVVPAGPDNPLGAHAMRLAIPGDYLIHGTNKPAGVGMRVSHGCIRMNPADIEWLFERVPVGLPVRIVNQPVLVGLADGELFLEAHPPLEEDKTRRSTAVLREIEKKLAKATQAGAGIDHERIARISSEQRGIPVPVRPGAPDLAASIDAAPRVVNIVSYDWFEQGEVREDAAPAAGTTPVRVQ